MLIAVPEVALPGEKETVTPLGCPEALKVTVPAKPPPAVTVMCLEWFLPRLTCKVGCEGAKVNTPPPPVPPPEAPKAVAPTQPANESIGLPLPAFS